MKIIITPTPTGVKTDVNGVVGQSCSSAVDKILRHMPTKSVTKEEKPEFYQGDSAQLEAE